MKTVNYSIVPKKNPTRPDESPKYYAQAQAAGEMTLNEMSDTIALMCTVTKPDILAVLAALEITMVDSLSSGFLTRFGELGSFRLTLRSEGADTKKEFNATDIKKAFVRFTPGVNLKDMLKTLKYKQVSRLGAKEKEEEPEGEE